MCQFSEFSFYRLLIDSNIKMDCFLRFQTVVVMVLAVLVSSSLGDFNSDVTITWGGPRGQIQDGGQTLSLSLDHNSGSGFQSNNQYMYARLDMKIKLVPGNSAGTVATFYLSSQGSSHDEIDIEFLGNSSGEPYTMHTNIYTNGVGNREQQFRLWFDPTTAFHTYTILWNSLNIIYMVDSLPIRVFKNYASNGVPFPSSQPMRMYASLWDAQDWATQGGRVKTDWSMAPFTVVYQNFSPAGCVVSGSWNSCNGGQNNQPWQNQVLDAKGRSWIRSVQQKNMIYNYCTDVNRFPQGLPPECKLPRF